jgi:hypothetical protein
MRAPILDFVPKVFFKVLAITLGLTIVGWAGALWIYRELSSVDIVGSLISALIFSYMVHLWIVYSRDHERER